MANTLIGNLNVAMGLDITDLQNGLKKAKAAVANSNISGGLGAGFGKVDQAVANTTGGVAKLGAAFKGLGPIAAIAGATVAGAFAFGIAQARQAAALGDDIADTANKLAVSTDALQEYRYAVHQLGGDYKDADAALEGFAQTFGAAQSGLSKKALKPFEALGLNPKDFKTTEDALRAVIEKISQLGSTAQQAAIADKLGLTAMLPALREGTAKIDEMRQAAHELGYVMDAELVAKAGEANDKFEDLSQVISVQFKSAFLELAPVIMEIMGLMADLAKATADFASLFQKVEDRSTRILTQQRGQVLGQIADLQFNRANYGRDGKLAPSVKAQIDRLQARERQMNATLVARQAAAAAPRRTGTTLTAVTGSRSGLSASDREARALASSLEKANKAARELRETLDNLGGADAQTIAEAFSNIETPTALLVEQWPVLTNSVAELGQAIKEMQANAKPSLDDLLADFDDISNSIADIGISIGSGDWGRAFRDITRAMQQVKVAFREGATSAEKFNAAAAAASGVGQIIGGSTGRAISSAANAGSTAFMLSGGNPVVAGVAALVAGVTSLFKSSKAKKKARAQAAEQARLEAERKAAEEAAIKRDLEIQLIELSGDAIGAQTERERDLLAALSPANAELQKQVWAQQKAAELAAQRRSLEESLYEAAGQSAEALKMMREDELKALPPELRKLQQTIYDVVDATQAAEKAQAEWERAVQAANDTVDKARSTLSDSYEREAAALTDVRDRFRALAQTLGAFRDELGAGAVSSDPRKALAEAQAAFNAVAGRTDAESLAKLPDLGRALIEAQKAAAPNARVLTATIDSVRAAVEQGQAAAEAQANDAESQLGVLKEQVKTLLDLNDNVISVRDAITSLSAAITAAQATSAAAIQANNDNVARTLSLLSDYQQQAANDAQVAASTAPTDIAAELALKLEPYLAQVVINTGSAARVLDDAQTGQLPFATVAI